MKALGTDGSGPSSCNGGQSQDQVQDEHKDEKETKATGLEDKLGLPAPPVLTSIAEGAVSPELDICGWAPSSDQSGDENGMELALLLARNSRCRNGSMGCAVANSAGVVIAGQVNSALWDSPNEKRPSSDIHAEVNAIGQCSRRGVATEGGIAYITMPPCRRCFTVLAAAGIRRIVMRKQVPAADAKVFRCAAKNANISLIVLEDTSERRGRVQQLVGAVKRKRAPEDEDQQLEEEGANLGGSTCENALGIGDTVAD